MKNYIIIKIHPARFNDTVSAVLESVPKIAFKNERVSKLSGENIIRLEFYPSRGRSNCKFFK